MGESYLLIRLIFPFSLLFDKLIFITLAYHFREVTQMILVGLAKRFYLMSWRIKAHIGV